jgi:hypothetical protein
MAITETQKYQYWAIAFAIIAVILAVLLIRSNNPGVRSGVDMASDAIAECSDGIKAWNEKYPKGTAPTVQSQNELIIVLQGCGAKSE